MSAPAGRPPPGTPLLVGVVVPAAGSGQRLGGRRKPWLLLAGEPVLLHALRPFLCRSDVQAIAVALAAADAADPPAWLQGLDPRVRVVAGGETRTASVKAALEALPSQLDVIVVHDAARPLLTEDLVDRCIELARAGKGAVAGYPAVDTLKEVGQGALVLGTPERSRFWHAQTPQAFPASLLRRAYASDAQGASDDAALVERAGGTVVMVEASPGNLKVTRPGDLPVAELLLGLAREERRAP